MREFICVCGLAWLRNVKEQRYKIYELSLKWMPFQFSMDCFAMLVLHVFWIIGAKTLIKAG